MTTITVDLDQMTATELAMLSKLISRSDREPIIKALEANCGFEHGMKLRSRALTLLDALEAYDGELEAAQA